MPTDNSIIPPWTRRDNFSTARHQQLVDGVNQAKSLIPGSGSVQTRQDGMGRSVSVAIPPQKPRRRFKITAFSTKPGTYTANPLNPAPILDPSTSSQLADSDFGIVDTATTVYLINDMEKAVPGHSLVVGRVCAGDFSGFAKDGRAFFAITEC